MAFYNDHIVPHVTNRLLDNREFAKLRAEECEGLHGDVIEVGFGSGLNLPHLPADVTGIWTVEPSRVAVKLASPRIEASTAVCRR
jgi:hypothetical protein